MDLGRFEISKGPSNRGGLDLGLFSKSNQPSRRGGLDLGPAGPPEALPLAEREVSHGVDRLASGLRAYCVLVVCARLEITTSGGPVNFTPENSLHPPSVAAWRVWVGEGLKEEIDSGERGPWRRAVVSSESRGVAGIKTAWQTFHFNVADVLNWSPVRVMRGLCF